MKHTYLGLILAFSFLTPSTSTSLPEAYLINPDWPSNITLFKTVCFLVSLVGIGYCNHEADKFKLESKNNSDYPIKMQKIERNRKISYGCLLLTIISIFCNKFD